MPHTRIQTRVRNKIAVSLKTLANYFCPSANYNFATLYDVIYYENSRIDNRNFSHYLFLPTWNLVVCCYR
jgi:hypothetical protein